MVSVWPPHAIAVSGRDVYVAGSTDGRFPGQPQHGGLDGFVARFGPNGSQRSLVQVGSQRDDDINALAASGQDVVAAGTTRGNLFGARHVGGQDAFVTVMDPNGNERWTRLMGGRGDDVALAVAALRGTVYVGGSTEGLRRSVADLDGFIGAFRSSGKPSWRYQIGGTSADAFTSIVARANGVYFAGSTDGQFLYDPAAGGTDALIGKRQDEDLEIAFAVRVERDVAAVG